jgi:vancomycin resistance protein YoaR
LAEPPGNWDDPLSSIGDTGEYPTAEVGQAHVLPPVPKQQPPKRISILEAQGSTSNTEALALRPMLPPVAEPWAEPSTGEQAAVPAPGVKRHDTSPQPLKRSSRSDKRAGQDKPGLIGRLQSKKWLIPALIGAGVLVIGFIGVSAALAGKVPNGASVAGVRIGGLSRQEAIDLLDRELGPKSRETVKVLVGESEVTFDPVIAGMGFSPKETVAAVTGFSLNPLRLLKHIGGTGEVAPALVVDQAALEAHVGELAAQTRVEPVGGTVTVAGGSVATTSPVIGAGLDQTGAASQIKKNYLIEEAPWRLPVDELAPKIGQEQIDEAVAQIATPLLSGPVEVSAGRAKVDLPASEIAAAAVIEPNDESGDSLILSWDTELLRASVSKRLPKGTETDPQDAHFVFIGGQPAIEDGRQGVQVNADQLANAMTTAATAAGAERRVTAELAQSDPSADRAALEKLGVKEVIGRFETQATNSADRTRNLRKAADMVTGILVKPGETFSLDDALGHRSLETGWYNAGVVVDGVTQDGIGGGLSQFSTTLYNAGHLAGMVDVEHTPHANYFSRYPTGREATIWEGQIDNKFKNDTPYGVVLRAGVSESLKVWVELWSTKYWSVETGIGQGYSYVAPRVIESTTDSCIPQASGGSGFQVDYWRIKTGPDGKALDRENWHWRYDPMNAIVCKETDE